MRMPASGLDPVSATLRLAFSPASKGEDLDSGVEASAKRVLLSSIEFEPPTNYQSSVLNALKSKYIVINTKHGIATPKLANGNNVNKKPNNVSLPVPKLTLFPPERVQLGYRGNISVGSGMANLGNTCYLNSTLQALFHVPALVNWLLSETSHQKCEQNSDIQLHPDDITCSVIKTFKCSQQKTGNFMKPISVYSKLKAICKHLTQGSQEDAHEFMRYLLESLEKNYLTRFQGHKLDNASKETTPINQIFGGYIRTEVTCLSCKAVSTTFQHFQDLPLDIRKTSTLNDALAGYFERERLPECEDAYKCEKCNRKVAATKKFTIEKPPNVLCVQLKRFSMTNGKITKQVQLPQYLDVTRFISQSVQPRHPVKYRLVSMVTHMGQSANCGHYTAIALAANGYYYQFDDSSVRQIPLGTVLNMSAYLVLYEIERPFTPHSPRPTPAPATVVWSNCNSSNSGTIIIGNNNNNNSNSNNHNNNNNNNSSSSSSSSSCASSNNVNDRLDQENILVTETEQESTPKLSSATALSESDSNRTGTDSQPRAVYRFKHCKIYSRPNNPPSLVNQQIGNKVQKTYPNPGRSSLVPYDSDVSTHSDVEDKDKSELEKLLTKSSTSVKGWEVTDLDDTVTNNSKSGTTNWSVTDMKTPKLTRNFSDTELDGRKKKKHRTSGSDSELNESSWKAKAALAHNRKKGSILTSILQRCNSDSEKNCEKTEGNRKTEENEVMAKEKTSPAYQYSPAKEDSSKGLHNGRVATENGSHELGTKNGSRSYHNGNSAKETVEEFGSRDSNCSDKTDLESQRVKESLSSSQNSHRGYGAPVKSWNGNRSSLDREVEEEKNESNKRSLDEIYNEEYDKGKTKKVKGNGYNREREWPRYNKFQERANQQIHHESYHWKSNGNGKFKDDYRHQFERRHFGNRFNSSRYWNYRKKYGRSNSGYSRYWNYRKKYGKSNYNYSHYNNYRY